MPLIAIQLLHLYQLIPLGGISLRAFGKLSLPGLVYALGRPYQPAVRQPYVDGVNRLHQSSGFLPVGPVE